MKNKNTKMILGTVIAIVVLVLIIVFARKGANSDGSAAAVSTNATSAPMIPAAPPVGVMTTTADGLQITTTADGSGAQAAIGDTVSVNYTGTLADGTEFDSNIDPQFNHVQPFSFTLGQNQVIPGWEEGVLGMQVGEKRHLVIPPALAYGAQGAGSAVPPNSTLTFDVELLSITPARSAQQ